MLTAPIPMGLPMGKDPFWGFHRYLGGHPSQQILLFSFMEGRLL